MKGIRGIRPVPASAAVAVALAGGLFLVMSAWAASGTLSVSDVTAEPGGSGSATVSADIDATEEEGGLGAWLVDLVYDPSVITAASCDGQESQVCNHEFAEDTVRMVGANATGVGVEETAILGNIRFDCAEAEGTSDLTVVVHTSTDATVGNPQDIEALTVEDGTFSCEEEKICGDVNEGGEVDAIDAQLILQFTADLIDSLENEASADTDGNGQIESTDALLILQVTADLVEDSVLVC